MDHLSGVGHAGVAGKDRRSGDREAQIRSGILRSAVFSALPESQLLALCSASSLVRFPRRRPIYSQGERADAIFVPVTGRVRVVRVSNGERALTVAYRGSGELIGETAVTDAGAYKDTATATEQVEAVRMPLDSVEHLLRNDASFAHGMLRLMVERRLEAERRIESLLSRTVESRVAEFLLDASERHGIPESRGTLIGVKYTHQEIADYVGSTRETVTLTLGDLKRRGIVLFDHRRVVVANPDALSALV